MHSHNNLSKLRRLSNTIQTKRYSSTLDPDNFSQTVKLPALNAISKSVKYGDVSFTMSRDLNKLRKQPEGPDGLAENLAHSTLLTVRRKYDHVNKERQEEEAFLHELEVERNRFKDENSKFQHQKSEGEKRVKNLEEQLKNIKIKGEEADMQKKMVSSMAERYKSDKLVFDQRKYIMEQMLNFIAKQKQIIIKESTTMKQEEDKTKKVYQKMMEHLEEQQRERQLHLTSISNMIEEKVAAYDANFGRHAQMKQIAENTLSEKDTYEKKWYKVHLCQRFVQKLLRDKMARQITKFGLVESAYKNIKTATGVSTTEELVHKFLNKESDYGILLGKIADNQKQISQLKAENEQINKEKNKLRAQKNALTFNKRQEADLTKEQKQLHTIDDKSTNCQLYMQKIATWLGKAEKKIQLFSNNKSVQFSVQSKPQVIIQHFTTYLNAILKQLQSQSIQIPNDKNIDSVDNANNKRIKIQTENPKEHHQNKSKQMTQYDQNEHVNSLRLQMIRNNQKIMKQLRKKFEEGKKQRLQAEPKKKEPSPDKPKQPAPADH